MQIWGKALQSPRKWQHISACSAFPIKETSRVRIDAHQLARWIHKTLKNTNHSGLLGEERDYMMKCDPESPCTNACRYTIAETIVTMPPGAGGGTPLALLNFICCNGSCARHFLIPLEEYTSCQATSQCHWMPTWSMFSQSNA